MRGLRRRHGRAAHLGGGSSSRYIAKCRACNAFTSGVTSGQEMHKDEGDPTRTGDVFTYYQPRGEVAQTSPGGLAIRCRLCRQARHAQLVRGRYNPAKKCSARCLSATGTSCECSCAGKNHGGGHSA